MFTFAGNKEEFFPSVGLKLTGACKLECPFCCEPDRAQEVYPAEAFIKILDALKKHGTKRLCITGGEPLLYPDLTKVLSYAHALGFYIVLLTSDGDLLQAQHLQILQYINAVRFSVHGLGNKHDAVVGKAHSFSAIEKAVHLLRRKECSALVTTVVSNANIDSIEEIAEWCNKNGVKEYFLFGLMMSGRGKDYIRDNGEASVEGISNIVKSLQDKYNDLEIVYYDYKKKSECILIYGDGRIVIDPYPDAPTYQAEIGNILTQDITQILASFGSDPENREGYNAHLDTIPPSEQ